MKKIETCPPMGWNSYDNYDTAVTEAQVRANAEYMAAHLKQAGYEYVVVDVQWYAPLADYVHSLGLKFGIHIMRGIPREAVHGRMQVFGTNYTAEQLAKPSPVCSWNPDMYAVDSSAPGAQAYYDGLIQLYTAWGVD